MKLLLIGASVRAACYSAVRANLEPLGFDLYGDQDLINRFPAVRIAPQDYPHSLPEILASAPAVPWMYTGALENRPRLLRKLARIRPLLGNPADVVTRVRRPEFLQQLLRAAGLAVPDLGGNDPGKRWLVKPRRGSAGMGVRPWDAAQPGPGRRYYLQEFIDGEPHAALFVGSAQGAWLAGVTRQLIGLDWVGSRGFHYCGSIGPLTLPLAVRKILQQWGDLLTLQGGLRGVFGIDFILQGTTPYPVEVNPRYTASVEVLERARKVAVLRWHVAAFQNAPVAFPPVRGPGVAGKIILFARRPTRIPTTGHWTRWVELVAAGYADIPAPGTLIEAHRPILSIVMTSANVSDCLVLLQHAAAQTYHALAEM